MHFTNTLIIDRPVTETFAFIANFENMPAWNYFVEETTSESPPGGERNDIPAAEADG